MARRGSVIAANSAIPSGVNRQTLPPSTPGAGFSNTLAGHATSGNLVNPSGGWGSTYGTLGLPRPPEVFTDGAFGPFSPILSIPVDESNEYGQVEARLEQYRVGWDLPTGTPGDEGLKLASFQELQTLADLYSVARACIEFLKAQIVSLEWDITPTRDAAKAMRNDAAAMKDFGERRAEAVKFFKHPDEDYFSWQSWISNVMEEVLVYDALSIVMRPMRGRGNKKGLLGSNLHSLALVNGPTIRPLYNLRGGIPRPPAVGYQQYLYGVPRVDLMTSIMDRDIEEHGLKGAQLQQFTGSQLMYLRMTPRRWTPYGFPPIERGLIPITTGLSKQGYQRDYFREGTVPAVYISPGNDLSPNQIRELQDALNAIAGDPAFHHKIIVLPSGSRVDPQRPTELADQFDEIVMAQTCMAFGVQPMQIGISPKVSTTQSPGAANQMAKMAGQQQDQSTLTPTLMFLTAIMEHVLHVVCGQPDMQFIFEGMREEQDEETQTNLLVNQISHALLTIDEGRDAMGKQPFGLPETSEPGVFTPTGFMTLMAGAAAQQQAQAQGAQAQQQPDTGQGDQQGATPDAGSEANQAKPATKPVAKPATQGASSGSKKPTGSGNPGQAAAEGAHQAAEQDADSKGSHDTTAGSKKAATPTATVQPQQAPPPAPDGTQDAAVAAAAALVAEQLTNTMLSYYGDGISLLNAVTGAVAAMEAAYYKALLHGAQTAAHQFHLPQLGPEVIQGLAARRAETQRPYLTGLAAAVKTAEQNGTDPSTWLPPRTKLYGEGLNAAWHEGYGTAAAAQEPDLKLVWRLGEAEHCELCLKRDGEEFTFKTLPGWPGDGGFGGPICLGGPNCNCQVDLVRGDQVLDSTGNTQRPEAPGYYAQQRREIMARRQQIADAKDQFINSLPNQTGSDNTSAQTRAQNREDLRRRLASLANQRIQSSGGYGGVSVEPQDIPASLIASLLPQYGPQPNVANLPLTALIDAVESMFVGKFTQTDLSKGGFTMLVLDAVMEVAR